MSVLLWLNMESMSLVLGIPKRWGSVPALTFTMNNHGIRRLCVVLNLYWWWVPGIKHVKDHELEFVLGRIKGLYGVWELWDLVL